MSEQEPTKRPIASVLSLQHHGRLVHTTSLGDVLIYPLTVRVEEALERQFGEQLDRAPADKVFEAFLKLSASPAGSDPNVRGLSAGSLATLTQADIDALATAALLDTDEIEDSSTARPVEKFITRIVKQGDELRESTRKWREQFKSLGLVGKSPAIRAFEEGSRASELIKSALGTSLGSRLSEFNADLRGPFSSAQSQLRKELLDTAAGAVSSRSPLVSPDKIETIVKPVEVPDFHRPTREHQAKLEMAGETVIGLAEAALLRINNLADFAQRFQVESAASGRTSLRIALWALALSVGLSVAQLVYSVGKDISDGPRQDEQMKLLRAQNDTASREIALLRDALIELRHGQPTQTNAPPASPLSPRVLDEVPAVARKKLASDEAHKSDANDDDGHSMVRKAPPDPLRDGAS